MRPIPGWQQQVVTWFGSGRAPAAPGTAGSLAAVPFSWLLARLGLRVHVGVGLGLAILGTLCADRYARSRHQEDPQEVVIDEVIGTLLALGLVRRRRLWQQLLAFVLFRALDINKPGIIDSAQRLQPPGVAIMADDVLAGVAAGLMARWLTGGR
jgi:phosphatidylglycerophosphatase A